MSAPPPIWTPSRPVASLLDDLLTNTLDPSYADAARRRATQAPASVSTFSARAIAILVLALAGLVLAIAVGQQRLGAPDAARARARLAAEVSQRTRSVAGLTAQIDALRADTAAIRDRELAVSRDGAQLTTLLRDLEQATGAVALHGPGLVVRVSDAPATGGAGRPAGSTREEGRIQDRDLQAVVNALWAAGAQGVAINGLRLTSQTAIRAAGGAILVDFRPLASPYDVSAVGPSDALQASFVNSTVARRFDAWTQLYRLGFSVRQVGQLNLPAAALTAPRHAIVLGPSATSAPSPPRQTTSSSATPSPSEHTP